MTANKPEEPLHGAAQASGIPITDEMVNAAAREMWNDRDARMGGAWESRDPREVCVIQTKATARAAITAALSLVPSTDRAAPPSVALEARVREVLGPFYKTVDVMKSARNGTRTMDVWADDMKAVEDVMFFLENLRDSLTRPQPGGAVPGTHQPSPEESGRPDIPPIPINWARPHGETFDQMRANVWASGLAEKGDTILIWVNEGDFLHACLTCGSQQHYTLPRPHHSPTENTGD